MTEEKSKRFSVRYFVRNLQDQIRTDRRDFIIYSVLRVLVIVTLVRSVIIGSWESVALCALSLVLFLLPAFAETRLNIEIPTIFEATIYLFIFAAEILGEVNHYYVLIPGWDTMLHTLNGFLCAAVGYSLVDLFNKHSDGVRLSPKYLALVAFCFSMTVGVLWEFVEFAMDSLFAVDMQKDFLVTSISSILLDPTGTQTPVRIDDIVQTAVTSGSGQTLVIEGGYLDIGLLDTMKDLLVNFVGAVVFCTFGYLYTSGRRNGTIVRGLLISRNGRSTSAKVARDEKIRRAQAGRPVPEPRGARDAGVAEGAGELEGRAPEGA